MRTLLIALGLLVTGVSGAYASEMKISVIDFQNARITYDEPTETYMITTDQIGDPAPVIVAQELAQVRLENVRHANPGVTYACQVKGTTSTILGSRVFVLLGIKDCTHPAR